MTLHCRIVSPLLPEIGYLTSKWDHLRHKSWPPRFNSARVPVISFYFHFHSSLPRSTSIVNNYGFVWDHRYRCSIYLLRSPAFRMFFLFPLYSIRVHANQLKACRSYQLQVDTPPFKGVSRPYHCQAHGLLWRISGTPNAFTYCYETRPFEVWYVANISAI